MTVAGEVSAEGRPERKRQATLLARENDRLKAQVEERTREVENARADAEKERQRVEAVLQDANHRIGNSLATVSSLLALQLLRSRSDGVRQALEAARLRVHAIASAHQRLQLGSGLETTSADEFIEAVITDIMRSVGNTKAIAMHVQPSPVVVRARDATALGILVGELVSNAIKHAFPDGRAGSIQVALDRDLHGVPTLVVTDDGIGLPDGQDEHGEGLGAVIIRQLSHQFGGKPDYSMPEGGGLRVRVPLPDIEASAQDVT